MYIVWGFSIRDVLLSGNDVVLQISERKVNRTPMNQIGRQFLKTSAPAGQVPVKQILGK